MTKHDELVKILQAQFGCIDEWDAPVVDAILDALMEPDADFDVAITKLEMEHSRADIKVLRGRQVIRAILTHIKEGR